jgi:hypothetical protein
LIGASAAGIVGVGFTTVALLAVVLAALLAVVLAALLAVVLAALLAVVLAATALAAVVAGALEVATLAADEVALVVTAAEPPQAASRAAPPPARDSVVRNWRRVRHVALGDGRRLCPMVICFEPPLLPARAAATCQGVAAHAIPIGVRTVIALYHGAW